MPWGRGQIVEEARYRRRYHEPCIQLMKYEGGGWSIRFCYYQHGRFQRSPLMLDVRELTQLRKALRRAPRLNKLLMKRVTTPDRLFIPSRMH